MNWQSWGDIGGENGKTGAEISILLLEGVSRTGILFESKVDRQVQLFCVLTVGFQIEISKTICDQITG